MNYENWHKATYQNCDDPTVWNGTNPSCKLCEKEIEQHDEYCEDHQRCIMCGDNDDCGCQEEFSQLSGCCEKKFIPETQRCSRCNKTASSSWEDAVDNCKN